MLKLLECLLIINAHYCLIALTFFEMSKQRVSKRPIQIKGVEEHLRCLNEVFSKLDYQFKLSVPNLSNIRKYSELLECLQKIHANEEKTSIDNLNYLIGSFNHDDLDINVSIKWLQKLLTDFLSFTSSNKSLKKKRASDSGRFADKRLFFSLEKKAWGSTIVDFEYADQFFEMLKAELMQDDFSGNYDSLLSPFNPFSQGFSRQSDIDKEEAENDLVNKLLINFRSSFDKSRKRYSERLSDEVTLFRETYKSIDNKNPYLDIEKHAPKVIKKMIKERIKHFRKNESLINNKVDLIKGFRSWCRPHELNKENKREWIKSEGRAKFNKYSTFTPEERSKLVNEWCVKNVNQSIRLYVFSGYTRGYYGRKRSVSSFNPLRKGNRNKKCKVCDISIDECTSFACRDYKGDNVTLMRFMLRREMDYIRDMNQELGTADIQYELWYPNKKFVPKNTFKLESGKEDYGPKGEEILKTILDIIEINPRMANKFLISLYELIEVDMLPISHGDEKLKLRPYKKGSPSRRFNPLIFFLAAKKESLIDTCLFSVADSFTRILLFMDGLYPYKEAIGISKYSKILQEIDAVTYFFKSFLNISLARTVKAPINKKLFIWELINHLGNLKKYIHKLEENGVFESDFQSSHQNGITPEDLYLISRRATRYPPLKPKQNLIDYLIELANKPKNGSKHLSFIYHEAKKGLKISNKKKMKDKKLIMLDYKKSIDWLKKRPGNRRLKDFEYSEALKEDLSFSDLTFIRKYDQLLNQI